MKLRGCATWCNSSARTSCHRQPAPSGGSTSTTSNLLFICFRSKVWKEISMLVCAEYAHFYSVSTVSFRDSCDIIENQNQFSAAYLLSDDNNKSHNTPNRSQTISPQQTFKSHLRYIGGVAVCAIRSSFNLINSLSLGYSSNLSASPTSRMKF